jgi:hypothetical protein
MQNYSVLTKKDFDTIGKTCFLCGEKLLGKWSLVFPPAQGTFGEWELGIGNWERGKGKRKWEQPRAGRQ